MSSAGILGVTRASRFQDLPVEDKPRAGRMSGFHSSRTRGKAALL